MEYKVDQEFIDLCKKIKAEGKTLSEWAEVESDDMFQSGKYVGGFDADEEEFCFSVYLDDGEHWFQISLEHIEGIANGSMNTVDIRPAE